MGEARPCRKPSLIASGVLARDKCAQTKTPQRAAAMAENRNRRHRRAQKPVAYLAIAALSAFIALGAAWETTRVSAPGEAAQSR
jgi:hypothetical protein